MYFEGNDLHHQTFLFMLQLRQDLASYIHQYTDIISDVVYDIIPDIEYTDIIRDIVSDIVPNIQYTDIVYDIICDIVSFIVYDIFTGWISSALGEGSCSLRCLKQY